MRTVAYLAGGLALAGAAYLGMRYLLREPVGVQAGGGVSAAPGTPAHPASIAARQTGAGQRLVTDQGFRVIGGAGTLKFTKPKLNRGALRP